MPAPSSTPRRARIHPSRNGGGQCIEVAPGLPGTLPVRDSKDPEGGGVVVAQMEDPARQVGRVREVSSPSLRTLLDIPYITLVTYWAGQRSEAPRIHHPHLESLL
ncbi:DUF397 domain-containing protein [Kitasatospora sp. NPDC059811]|uniref:DUF397 domain-containing protein n=1 Tax=Streptomycetaceae TaxID=2062 RepID=UPI00099FA450|nr:DUF397 domain-containing protein [Streptomyces sp. MJM8645]